MAQNMTSAAEYYSGILPGKQPMSSLGGGGLMGYTGSAFRRWRHGYERGRSKASDYYGSFVPERNPQSSPTYWDRFNRLAPKNAFKWAYENFAPLWDEYGDEAVYAAKEAAVPFVVGGATTAAGAIPFVGPILSNKAAASVAAAAIKGHLDPVMDRAYNLWNATRQEEIRSGKSSTPKSKKSGMIFFYNVWS